MSTPSTVIIGLGNPIMCDDAVGIVIGRAVHERLGQPGHVTFIEASAGGFELIELIHGFDRAVIVDAIQTEGGAVGDYHALSPEDLRTGVIPSLSHQVGLIEGLELGPRLGMKLPDRLRIYAIEVADPFTFGTELTPEVAAAVPTLVNAIVEAEFSG